MPSDWLQVLFRIFDEPYLKFHPEKEVPSWSLLFISSRKHHYSTLFAHEYSLSRFLIITYHSLLMMDRDSSVGIATCYWLNGLRFGSRWARHFPHPSRLALRPTQRLVQRVQDSVVERPGRGVGHPPLSSIEIKENVDVYLSPPLWVFMAIYRLNLCPLLILAIRDIT